MVQDHAPVALKQMDAPEPVIGKRHVVILTIEGLGCNLVGSYGGAIAPTKNWDSFASRAIVFDQYWADTLLPYDVLESMWSGTHFGSRQGNQVASPMQWENGLLVTDSLSLVENMDRDAFGDVLFAETSDSTEGESGTTHIEQLIETALGAWANQLSDYPFLWIHSKGLSGKWDAPYEYRMVMCDDGDPDPPRETEPASLRIMPNTDPDEIFGWACAAGGQSIAYDDAWSIIENALGELGLAESSLLVLAGVAGFPMGEHGWVGTAGQSLYAETIHLPLIIRPGHQLDLGIRVPFMVQPHMIASTIRSWLGGNKAIGESASPMDLVTQTDAFAAEHWPPANQVACSLFQDQIHVAVPAWSCRWECNRDQTELPQEKAELFAMPDDRWQQNEISQRALEVLESMVQVRAGLLDNLRSGSLANSDALPKELINPQR